MEVGGGWRVGKRRQSIRGGVYRARKTPPFVLCFVSFAPPRSSVPPSDCCRCRCGHSMPNWQSTERYRPVVVPVLPRWIICRHNRPNILQDMRAREVFRLDWCHSLHWFVFIGDEVRSDSVLMSLFHRRGQPEIFVPETGNET